MPTADPKPCPVCRDSEAACTVCFDCADEMLRQRLEAQTNTTRTQPREGWTGWVDREPGLR